jgi:hypothetical protein
VESKKFFKKNPRRRASGGDDFLCFYFLIFDFIFRARGRGGTRSPAKKNFRRNIFAPRA